MIKSHQQAKDFAKKLKSTLADSGLYFPLHACQQATARAAGFASWQALTQSKQMPEPADAARFQTRLLAAVPFACRPPVNAWLSKDRVPEAIPGYPPRWYLDAVPYFLATMALHRRTPLLRPGSGSGQKLRARIIDHLLLEWARWGLDAPLFDPVTFDFVYVGNPEHIFAAFEDSPDFARERDRLVAAGILKLDRGSVRLASPGIDGVKAHAIWSRASKAKDMVDHDFANAAEPVYEALSLIGVRRAQDIALALLAYGDKRYIVASGSLREVLSDIARDGDLEVFAHALNVFAMIVPASARELRDAVPAKILNEFVARNQQVPIARAFRWMEANPDWADALRSSANHPAGFTVIVDAMVEDMRAA